MLKKLFAKIDDSDWEFVGTYDGAFWIRVAKLNFENRNARYPKPNFQYREEPVDNT